MRSLLITALLFLTLAGMAQFQIPRDEENANGDSNYQDVEAGDVIYIQSGQRKELLLQNFHGTEEKPIIFRPSDWNEEVLINSQGNYGISIRNCSHVIISGWQGANGRYGIHINRAAAEHSVGISISDKSSSVELGYIEIANVGFAGILAKTEPDCNDPGTLRGAFVQEDTKIHHCYIHDTQAEGLYIGNTQFKGLETNDCGMLLPHLLEGVEIHHNKIERTGWDGIQVSSAIKGCKIYNNELIDCSIREDPAQRSGIIIGGGTTADCYNNTIVDCHATGILVFGNAGTRVFNNLIIRPALNLNPEDPYDREHGIYVNDKTNVDDSFYGIYSNTIIQPKSDGIRISPTVTFETRIYNNMIIDPGSWDVYENDNTDYTGNDSFIFLENEEQNVTLAANAFLKSIELPRFVDVDQDDYHLAYNSQYVDAGRDLSDQGGINFDLDNKRRPKHDGWDIGAFEYGDASTVPILDDSSEHVKVRVSKNQGADFELVVYVSEPGFVKWNLFSITGQTIKQTESIWYEQGEYHFNLGSSINGINILQLEGAGWWVSEKLLLN